MTNNKLFLLIGTSLSLVSQLSFAQCIVTQDCATLGYTETSCSGGSGVKCPFGNKWACFKSESEIKQEVEQEFCNEYGFTFSCTGTNQSGSGKACNGKYNYCNCAEGYVWQNGDCKQTAPDYAGCTIGALFYSDNTCSSKLESSKTLLGVVIYEKTATQMGWIMTVKPVKTSIKWGGYGTDISDLPNITSESSLTDIQASCTNTDIITAKGSNSTYPAAWAAKNYKPIVIPSGQSWCLPSGGLLKNALGNSVNFAKVNAGITIAGGTILGNVYNGGEYVWSSSEDDGNYAWGFVAHTNGSFNMDHSGKNYDLSSPSVRPVLAF